MSKRHILLVMTLAAVASTAHAGLVNTKYDGVITEVLNPDGTPVLTPN